MRSQPGDPESLPTGKEPGTRNQGRSSPPGLTAEVQPVGSRACHFRRGTFQAPLAAPPQHPHCCCDYDKAFSYQSKLAPYRLAHSTAHPHPCPNCPKALSYLQPGSPPPHAQRVPANTCAYTAQRPLAIAPSWQPTSGLQVLLLPLQTCTSATHTMPPMANPILVVSALWTFSFPSKLATQSLCHVPPPTSSPHGTRQQAHGPGITTPAVSRPLAKDTSCSVSKAANTRLRARWSESELFPLGSRYPLPPTWSIKRWHF